ncbi:hypothetical protein JCM15519_36080 [Fundidesulfovibrio butyratiphilus]
MARAKKRVNARESRMALAVLAVLCCVAAWLFWKQAAFNPAVTASLTRTTSFATTGQSAPETSAGATMLTRLADATPLGPAEAWNRDTLSDKIDGKAELYLASGFKGMHSRPFSLPGLDARVEVSVYEMESAKDAFAVESGQRRADAAESRVSSGAYATQNALFFTSGPYYVEMVADKAAPDLRARLEKAAASLLAALPATKQSAPLAEADLLPREGRTDSSMRMTVSDAFGLEGFSNVFTADYSLAGAEVTGYATMRETPEQAQAQARAFADFLTANGYVPVKDPQLPAAAKLFTLENMAFETVIVSGNVLAGAHEATSRQAALHLTAALAKILSERTP